MAPCKYRGAINIGFQPSITIGVLFANGLNYIFSKFIKGGWGWRFNLSCAMFSALVVTIGSIFLS
ncbi:sugar transporter [Medicago truncatula]|uniref:Sugar transporter n=1 Tax=Medicago truncatula TaxID=3880 RepID=A0A072VP86_MEDTR|nr:sugar transporter [Medicago truncatula]